MAYKYQIKEGAENRVFANARNLGDGLVESDEPLDSPYLTLIKDGEQMTAQKPDQPVAAPPAPIVPPTPPAPAPPSQPAAQESN